jgi:CBS domain-containing protein
MDLNAKALMKDFVKVFSDNSVSEMLGALAKAKQSTAIVFDSAGKYLGVSSKLAVLRKRIDYSRVKVENVFEKKPLLSETDSVQSIAEQMIGSNSKVLPVQENGKIIGAVFANDVVKHIKAIKELAELKAKEIATSKPVVLPIDSTLGKVINTMQEMHVSKIPIVDKDNQIKGIVAYSDLVESLSSQQAEKPRAAFKKAGKSAHDIGNKKADLLELPVSRWVQTDVRTVAPNDKLSKVIDAMSIANISDVIVAERNKIVGFIALSDLLESFVRLKKDRKNIQFVNLPELDEIDSQFLSNAIVECYDKIKKVLGEISYLVVHFKFLEGEGLRKQTTVHLRLSAPGKLFVASSTGWVLLDTVHEAIKKLEREVFESAKK